jgi:hypothetical protein
MMLALVTDAQRTRLRMLYDAELETNCGERQDQM